MGSLTRRDFFCALAASVVVAGGQLPVGFPEGGGTTWLQTDYTWDPAEHFFELVCDPLSSRSVALVGKNSTVKLLPGRSVQVQAMSDGSFEILSVS